MPVLTIYPVVALIPEDGAWDIPGLVEEGSYKSEYRPVFTNVTYVETDIEEQTIKYAEISGCNLNEVILISCEIDNCTITNSTIRFSNVENTYLEEVVISFSYGTGLTGEDIYSKNSNLEFSDSNLDEFDLDFLLPFMINVVLLIFIVLPAALPTLIASYSIVGEKNNKSLEPLLATPTTDEELLAGKVLSAFVPTMVGTYIAFIASVIIIDILLFPKLGYAPVPNVTWIMSILLLSPTACLMSILACVFISSKVTDVRAAQQLGGFVIMPIIVLMLMVFSGLILLSPVMVLIVAAIYIGIDLGLFYFAKSVFNREAILVKWA
jgi:ABC-2 type transport system permease protein